MYGDQFGEFVCWYWGLKGLKTGIIITVVNQLKGEIKQATIINSRFAFLFSVLRGSYALLADALQLKKPRSLDLWGVFRIGISVK